MGKEIKIKFVSDRTGHDRRYCIKFSLSYEVTLLKEGLEKTYESVSYTHLTLPTILRV